MTGLTNLFAARRSRSLKAGDHRIAPLVASVSCSELPDNPPGITPTPATEAWLEARAENLNGDWTVARLAGLGRQEGRLERLCALSTLSALEELRLKADLDNLYTDKAVQVFTMKESLLGQLEPAAAALFHEQQELSNVVRAFVYGTQWAHNDCTGVQIALVTWAPFQKGDQRFS